MQNLNYSSAVKFSKKWENARKEKSESQIFIRDFFKVLGIELKPAEHLEYKIKKRDGRYGSIDCFVKGKIAIEMKSRGEDLNKAFEQLKEYIQGELPEEDTPKILMVCDFETIILDFNKKKPEFKTKDLQKYLHLFRCLFEEDENRYREQIEANVKAAEKMAVLHKALESGGYTGHNLEVYLVRLLYCMFAEDTQIFPRYLFLDYIKQTKKDGSDVSEKIARLFEILDTSDEYRKRKYNLPPELLKFQYINGNLFKEKLNFPDFTEKMRETLIKCAEFDWSGISPAIFGAMFQGVMNKEDRRNLGVHYTSEKNILKIIKPLFMDSLWEEFERVKNIPKRLDEFHTKIGKLKFLDPACGCGNFLIIAYQELRELEQAILENKMIKGELIADYLSNSNSSSKIAQTIQGVFDVNEHLVRVELKNFYGIECEEFPCEIAKVGMWLMEHKMNTKLSKLGLYRPDVPLNKGATIIHKNALRIDWEDIVPKNELSFILGNPPFVGHQNRSPEQKEDMQYVYKDSNKFGKLDYVCCWYQKAVDYMKDTCIEAAFVSTNSIVQGESVSLMWKPIFERNFEITFAYPSFVWNNEAKGKAAVHCVIIGFAQNENVKAKQIYTQNKDAPPDVFLVTQANNINGYLLNAPNVFIQSRGKPLNPEMPEMSKGSQPTDGGNLILSESERNALVSAYPQTEKWIKRYVGADEFINNNVRYCLWLKGIMPAEYRLIKPIMQRLEKVADMRKESPTESVRHDAETPMLFTQIRQPETDYIVIPETSSEKRKYIPIGFMSPKIIVNNSVQVIPNATLYIFGVLTSNIHNAWMRVVCGRLKSDFRYTPAVYNNFPYPNATNEQKASIEKLAQGVLDTRAKFPTNSLADLYDPLTMPPELQKTHRELDSAVMKLYGFGKNMTELDIVARLMEMYKN